MKNPLTWPFRLAWFGVWFLGQILTSNIRVIADIVTRHDYSTPLVLRLPTKCRGDFEMSLLSILISLTPGTLVLAIDRDQGTTLYIHAMYDDHDEVLTKLKELEHRMENAVRPRGVDG